MFLKIPAEAAQPKMLFFLCIPMVPKDTCLRGRCDRGQVHGLTDGGHCGDLCNGKPNLKVQRPWLRFFFVFPHPRSGVVRF